MYGSSMKSETFPLAMPPDLLGEVRQAAKRTGLSMADVIRQSAKLGLPALCEQLGQQNERVTNVDPLPKAVLQRIYSQRDDDEEGIRTFIKAQSFGGRD
jgi:hypothetical protein